MKTYTFRLSAYLLLLLLLPGCALEGFFSKDHVLTNPDGSTYRVPFLADDYSKQMQGHERIKPFSLADHTRIYKEEEQHQYQELTAANLQQIAQQNKLTLTIKWLPHCAAAYQSEVVPFFNMIGRLKHQNINFNSTEIRLVLTSVSYDILSMDSFFAQKYYPYQTYIIPAEPYHKRLLLKEARFNKELMPEIYESEKDDIHKYVILLLNNEGKVISKISSSYEDKERFSIDLAKLEQKILALNSETAQH